MWTLDDRCFKIDKTNAKAMINGYLRNGVLIRQAIWCAVKDAPFPMLITLNRTRTKFQMSRIGENLLSDDYIIPYKYIADVDPDDEYFIRNDPRLWATVCNNGLSIYGCQKPPINVLQTQNQTQQNFEFN